MENTIKNIKEKKYRQLVQLFFSTMYISAFTFGGGFVIITFMKKKFVDELHWIDEQEMLDLTALAQSSPGAIAVNAAILVGYRIGGFLGSLIAIIGTILPPMCILCFISFFYNAFSTNIYFGYMLKGMQAGVAAIIIDVVLDLGEKVVHEKNLLSIIIMVVAFCASFFFNVNVIYIILCAAMIGVLKVLLSKKGRVK